MYTSDKSDVVIVEPGDSARVVGLLDMVPDVASKDDVVLGSCILTLSRSSTDVVGTVDSGNDVDEVDSTSEELVSGYGPAPLRRRTIKISVST